MMPDVKPFVLLSSREDDAAALGEAASIRQIAKLGDGELVQIRLEREPMPSIDFDDVSGFLIGGSDYCVSSDNKSPTQRRVEAELFDLLRRAIAADFPVLGLCYGMGLLAAYLGGTVGKTYGETIRAIAVSLTPEGRDDRLLAGSPDCFHAFVGHKEAVDVVPSGAVVLASGVDCPVQLLRAGRNVYAAQYHPELDAEALVVRMELYKNFGYFDPQEFDAIASAARNSPVDGSQHKLLTNFVTLNARQAG